MITDLPRKLSPGDKFPTAAWFNQLLDAIRARTPIAGPGILADISTHGTSLRTNALPAQTIRQTPAMKPKEFLSPVKCTTPDGQPGWSVTDGTINGSVGATTMPDGKHMGYDAGDGLSSDYTYWAQPFTEEGVIFIKVTDLALAGQDPTEQYLASSITLEPFPAGHQWGANDTITTSRCPIGYIRNTAGVWTVTTLNTSNKSVRAVGGGWDWWEV